MFNTYGIISQCGMGEHFANSFMQFGQWSAQLCIRALVYQMSSVFAFKSLWNLSEISNALPARWSLVYCDLLCSPSCDYSRVWANAYWYIFLDSHSLTYLLRSINIIPGIKSTNSGMTILTYRVININIIFRRPGDLAAWKINPPSQTNNYLQSFGKK